MKKVIPIIVFIIAFIGTYFALSFCIPGWRIKLEAAPFVIFIETLKIIWPMKALIALVIGAVLGAGSFIICKKK